MTTEIKWFLKGVVTLTIILAILMAFVFGFFLQSCFHPAFPFILLFSCGFSMFTFFRMEKASHNEFAKFVQVRMLVTVLRLFVYIIIAILYIAFIKQGIPCFVILLGLFYMVYTSFEVYMLTYRRKN